MILSLSDNLKANSRSARDALVDRDCIRAATVSIRAPFIQLLAIIATIGTIIVHKTATWIGIQCANQARTQSLIIMIVRHYRFTLSHCSFILISIGRIGLPNVSQPSLSHGRTELISQTFNQFCNCSTFIDLNVIRNTEISANLSTKCNKHNNSNNINK
jgi:hypothetical protein